MPETTWRALGTDGLDVVVLPGDGHAMLEHGWCHGARRSALLVARIGHRRPAVDSPRGGIRRGLRRLGDQRACRCGVALKAGWSVCVLEREAELGGCIRTSTDLTVPGFTHEVLASWHPLFTGSPAYAELKPELDRRGLEYLNTELPTGAAYPDGSAAFLTTSLEDNVAELARHAAADGPAWESMFNAFMANADLSFGVLGTELWSPAGLGLGRQALRRFGRRGLLEYVGGVLASCRDWLGDTFESDAAHGLLAPWVLHTGLGPDQATSGFMTQVIACALQLGGMPVPKGGGRVLVDGLAGIVRDSGGEVRSGVEVERVLVSSGRPPQCG